MSYPLQGVKVLELEGIGPGPLGCCILADFGADVISVSRVSKGRVVSQNDPVSRGKRSIALDLKSDEGKKTFLELAKRIPKPKERLWVDLATLWLDLVTLGWTWLQLG